MPKRCQWADKPGSLLADYHDREWGVPLHQDQRLFEFLILDAFQAGLSWEIVLKKRENFRQAFARFDASRIAAFGEAEIQALLGDPGIIRNRLKINAAVTNAQAFLRVREEEGSFDAYLWKFVGGKPRINCWKSLSELPAKTPEAEAMSRDLIKRGFKFVGPTICYAFMQAAGMVNDHTVDCFRYAEINRGITENPLR